MTIQMTTNQITVQAVPEIHGTSFRLSPFVKVSNFRRRNVMKECFKFKSPKIK